MTSYLAVSLLLTLTGQSPAAPQALTQASPPVRGTQVQTEVWDQVKESVAILPDAAGQPFGLAVLVDPQGYFVAHSSAIIAEPVTAILESGEKVRLGRIGYDSTTQLVLLGAQNWTQKTRSAIAVADPAYPAKDMTMVTVDGLVRSTINRQNVPGVVQLNNRYIPLNEIQFERMAAPVGGALVFNRNGELMGVLGATLAKAPGNDNRLSQSNQFGPQGMTVGYALSPKVLRRVISGFLTPEHTVQHPNIGILFKDNPLPRGAVVTQVNPDSPAAQVGLQVGDVITAFDDEPVAGGLDLATRLFDKDPGETIVLTIERNGRTQKTTLKVGIGQSLF